MNVKTDRGTSYIRHLPAKFATNTQTSTFHAAISKNNVPRAECTSTITIAHYQKRTFGTSMLSDEGTRRNGSRGAIIGRGIGDKVNSGARKAAVSAGTYRISGARSAPIVSRVSRANGRLGRPRRARAGPSVPASLSAAAALHARTGRKNCRPRAICIA